MGAGRSNSYRTCTLPPPLKEFVYERINQHLFEVKEYSKDAHSGVQTLVTPKGRETLRLLLT